MYIEELSNSDYSSFPPVTPLFDVNADESQDVSDVMSHVLFVSILTSLSV